MSAEGQNLIRCKRDGRALAVKLDGGLCICRIIDDCPFNPKPGETWCTFCKKKSRWRINMYGQSPMKSWVRVARGTMKGAVGWIAGRIENRHPAITKVVVHFPDRDFPHDCKIMSAKSLHYTTAPKKNELAL